MRVFLVLAVLMLAGCADSDSADAGSGVKDEGQMETSTEPLTFYNEGTLIIGTQGADSCGLEGTLDTMEFTWNLPEGQKYSDFEIVLEFGASGLDLDLTVSGPSGDQAATSFNTLEGTSSETILYSGSVTPGDYSVTVVGCVGAAADFSVTGAVDVSEMVVIEAIE
jgi:hypothetical protein